METIYVVTHAIMMICLIGIIYTSLPSVSHEVVRSVVSNLILKVKPKWFSINSLYYKIAGLLALFIR